MQPSRTNIPASHVLLIGSNDRQLEDLRLQLSQHGYEAVVTEPETAARTAEATKSAGIIADLRAGEMDLTPVLASVRNLQLPFGNVPIVILLSQSQASEVTRYQATGATAVLTEPFSIEGLAVTLRAWGPLISPEHSYLDGFALAALAQTYGRENFAALLNGFFEEAREQVGLINQASDPQDIKRLAHTLKSTARMFGAHALFAAARDLEHASQDNPRQEGLRSMIERVGTLLTLTEKSYSAHSPFMLLGQESN